MGVRSRLIVTAAALGAAFAVGACGEDDFENEPRPASPIEVTALINDRKIKVSPSTADAVGAGLVNFTISNQSQDPAALVLEGPTDDASNPIQPGGVGSLKTELEEGDYVVSAGTESDANEGSLDVGPPRPSSQNDLLQP
jgi:hypothetical protein